MNYLYSPSSAVCVIRLLEEVGVGRESGGRLRVTELTSHEEHVQTF